MTGTGRFDIGEGPPTALYVSDQGWTVIRTADVFRQPIELIAISLEGKEKIRIDVFKTLFEDHEEMWRYVGFSTAGQIWGSSYCHFYFIQLGNAPHFCLRTWWGQRLLLKLDAGERARITDEFEHELLAAEKDYVLTTLQQTKDWNWEKGKYGGLVPVDDPKYARLGSGLKAMHMAGTMKVAEAVPFLKNLESCSYSGSTTGSSGDYQPPPGGIKPYSYRSLTIRQMAKLSLRRLGVRPSLHQSMMLYREGDGFWHPQDPLPFQRDTRAAEIKAGMRPEEVLDQIGAPDFIERRMWEYDMDGKTPYTLIVSWGKDGVETIERHTPPKWSDGTSRDLEFTR